MRSRRLPALGPKRTARGLKIETADNGDEIEREIPFMKGYPVFCVEQIYGLPEHFYARPSPARARTHRCC